MDPDLLKEGELGWKGLNRSAAEHLGASAGNPFGQPHTPSRLEQRTGGDIERRKIVDCTALYRLQVRERPPKDDQYFRRQGDNIAIVGKEDGLQLTGRPALKVITDVV